MPFRADPRWKRCGVTMLGSAKRFPPHRLILLTFLSRFLQVFDDNKDELFICMAWGLWNRRNTLRLGLPSPPLDRVGPHAAKFPQEFINAQADQFVNNLAAPPSLWCPPISLGFKANSDGAVFSSTHLVGMGMVICNSRGEVIAAMAERIPHPNSVVEVEALACCRAVKFAFEIGIQEDFSRET